MPEPDLRPDPAPPDPAASVSAGRGCIAVAMIAIGAMILIPSGLCTAIMGVGAMIDLFTKPGEFLNDLEDIGPFALDVLVVAAIGFALVYAGNKIRKRF